MVLELKKIDSNSDYDLAFTFGLRNENREFFFENKLIRWCDHVNWFTRRDGSFEFYLIMCDNERAGTIAVEHREDCEFLQNLCVDDKFRGRGLAKWAITQLMKKGRFIVAQVKTDNKHVIKMYEKLGFWRAR